MTAQDKRRPAAVWQIALTLTGIAFGVGAGWAAYVELDPLTRHAGVIGLLIGVGAGGIAIAAALVVGLIAELGSHVEAATALKRTPG